MTYYVIDTDDNTVSLAIDGDYVGQQFTTAEDAQNRAVELAGLNPTITHMVVESILHVKAQVSEPVVTPLR